MTATRFPGVYRTQDGRTAIRAVVRDASGQQMNRTRILPAGTSDTEAAKAALDLKHQLEMASQPDSLAPEPNKLPAAMTVTDFAASWLLAKTKILRPSVALQYEGSLSKILPVIGSRPIRDLTRRDIEQWVGWAQAQVKPNGEPYSQDTLRAWYRVLGCMVRDAAAELDLDRDPMRRVKPPKGVVAPRREKGTLSREQLNGLLAAAEAVTPARLAEVATMALTGMRAGEVYALKFEDIDFANGAINVRHSQWHGTETATKTGDPRVVPLHPRLAAALVAHRAALEAKRHRGLRTGLVFPSDLGTYRHPSALTGALALAAEAAGITHRVTPQVLRRTFNTLMMLAGTDRIALRAMMGHTSEQMTERYSGVGLEVKQAAVANLFGDR